MLSIIRSELLARLGGLDEVLTDLQGLEAANPPGYRSTAQLKGLFFVYSYAIYEFTIFNSTIEALRFVDASNIPLGSMRPSLLAALLHPDLCSLSDLSVEKSWDRRVKLFDRSREAGNRSPIDPHFPADGSHFRPSQLITIWNILGISSPTLPEMRCIGRIQEMVEHRNAIAHGRERPETIGGRFTVTDLVDRRRDLEALCTHFVSTLETHCLDSTNLVG